MKTLEPNCLAGVCFSSRRGAAALTWSATSRSDEGVMSHVFGSAKWKWIDGGHREEFRRMASTLNLDKRGTNSIWTIPL